MKCGIYVSTLNNVNIQLVYDNSTSKQTEYKLLFYFHGTNK